MPMIVIILKKSIKKCLIKAYEKNIPPSILIVLL